LKDKINISAFERIKGDKKMTTELNPNGPDDQEKQVKIQSGSSDAVYGLGLIGAWIYYIGRATTPRERILGFFKGLVWPVFVVRDLLYFLNKDE
jgi:hypothetical protein